MAKKCDHATPQWHLDNCNEEGWKCAECGHAFGFRPDFDREHTVDKVETILFWLVEHDLLYVSNASEADGATAAVVKQCHAEDTFDQQFIVYHLAAQDLPRHIEFWRTAAKQAMCSHPSRTLVARPTRQDPDGAVSRCNACEHEVEQGGAGPLFGEVSK